MSGGRDAARSGVCPRCGALNGADFDRCIRCGVGLSARAASIDASRGHVEGRSLLGTKLIIGATVVIFALQMAASFSQRQPSFAGHSRAEGIDQVLLVLRFGAMPMTLSEVLREPWRLLSAVFVHYDVLHILMNMLGLANLGRIAEPALGTARFLLAYVITGIVGFALTVLYAVVAGGNGGTTAGASGAVLGVMGLILGFMIRRRDPQWKGFAMQALIYGVVFGFVVNASNAGVLVNNSAHIGGLLSGTILGLIFAGPRSRSDLAVNVAAGLAVLACVAAILLPHGSALPKRLQRLSGAPSTLAPLASQDAALPAPPSP